MGVSEHNNVVKFMRTQILWMLWVFNGGYLNIVMGYMLQTRNYFPYLQRFWILICLTISYMKPKHIVQTFLFSKSQSDGLDDTIIQ